MESQELHEKNYQRGIKSNFKIKKKIVGSASAKFILLGEYAVVYDHMLLLIQLMMQSKLALIIKKKTRFHPFWFPRARNFRGSEYFSYFKKTPDVICKSYAVDVPLVHFDINSQVPLAMGLGASASIAVALSNVLSNYFGSSKNSEEINKIAFECEKINHILPSGIDNTVASFGKAVFYNKNKPINVLSKKYSKSLPIIIAMSKSPSKTFDLVARCGCQKEK